MRARMGGGLLQDTVSPLGDMVHYLAKASFLQDMLLGMFVFWGFFFFVSNHCCSESFLTQQALHPYNISCIVVPQ
jgi:hypothetical protein